MLESIVMIPSESALTATHPKLSKNKVDEIPEIDSNAPRTLEESLAPGGGINLKYRRSSDFDSASGPH